MQIHMGKLGSSILWASTATKPLYSRLGHSNLFEDMLHSCGRSSCKLSIQSLSMSHCTRWILTGVKWASEVETIHPHAISTANAEALRWHFLWNHLCFTSVYETRVGSTLQKATGSTGIELNKSRQVLFCAARADTINIIISVKLRM